MRTAQKDSDWSNLMAGKHIHEVCEVGINGGIKDRYKR